MLIPGDLVNFAEWVTNIEGETYFAQEERCIIREGKHFFRKERKHAFLPMEFALNLDVLERLKLAHILVLCLIHPLLRYTHVLMV